MAYHNANWEQFIYYQLVGRFYQSEKKHWPGWWDRTSDFQPEHCALWDEAINHDETIG